MVSRKSTSAPVVDRIRIRLVTDHKGFADCYLVSGTQRLAAAMNMGCGTGRLDTVLTLPFTAESAGAAVCILKSYELEAQKPWARLGSSNNELNGPTRIICRQRGQKYEFYVADSRNHRIVSFDANGRAEYVFGAFGRTDGALNLPNDVAITHGLEFVVSDSRNRRLVFFNHQGRYLGNISRWRGEPLFSPAGVAVDAFNRIVAVDRERGTLVFFSRTGEFLFQVSAIGQGLGFLQDPVKVVCRGTSLYIVDRGHSRVLELDQALQPRRVIGNGVLLEPEDAACREGEVWVLDGSRLHLFGSNSSWGGCWDGLTSKGSGLCAGDDERLLITDFALGRILPFRIRVRTSEIKIQYKRVQP